MAMPVIFTKLNCSFKNKKAKIAVNTGIRLENSSVFATPISRALIVKKINANELAKIDKASSAKITFVSGRICMKLFRSKIMNSGRNKNTPIIF